MHLLVPLAALLGIETDVLMDRLKKSVAVSAAIALFALVGLTFLLVAANTALTLAVGPVWAPLIIAGIAIVIALVIFIAAKLVAGERKSRDTERRRSSETTAFVTTAALTALPMVLRSPLARKIGLPLAALVAIALFSRSGSNRADTE